MNEAELRSWLTLTLAPGLGSTLTRRCVDAMGSPAAVLQSGVAELEAIRGIGRKKATLIHSELDRLADGRQVDAEWELIERQGARLLTPSDGGYPTALLHIPDAPPLLYVRGELRADDAVALAIVGSRRCTHYGREQADRLASLCAAAGLCIVSGGAYGIDAAAHTAALRGGGRTIAVLGSGLARPYPQSHIELFDRIVDGRGALLSELPMTAAPIAENFPRRNRIISGLALGVLVVEAARRSGAMVTARLAAEEHGREVMAVPGRVDSATSAGCHRMIREGWATLVTNAADVLDALGETGRTLRAAVAADDRSRDGQPMAANGSLTESQSRIVDSLDEPRGLDQICDATGLAVQMIQSDLTMLEIQGLIEKSGASFCRRR